MSRARAWCDPDSDKLIGDGSPCVIRSAEEMSQRNNEVLWVLFLLFLVFSRCPGALERCFLERWSVAFCLYALLFYYYVCLLLFVPVVPLLLCDLWFFLVVLEGWCYSFRCTRCSCTCVRVCALFFVTRDVHVFYSVFSSSLATLKFCLFVCSRCSFVPSLLL